jgi:Type I phosphodiesterase / nucleotide pyrophosphatase
VIDGRVRTTAWSILFAASVIFLPRLDALALISSPPGWQPPNVYTSIGAHPRYVFVFVIDGGIPSYLKLGDFPHIAGLSREGITYTRAWDGMLETETPTGHASLGTGSLPRRHGVLSFSWVRDNGSVEHPTNPVPIAQGDLERVLAGSGVPSIASELKRADPSATTVVTSGHKDYAVDSVGGPYADYLMFYTLRGQTWAPVAIPRHVPPRPVLDAPGLTAYAPTLGPGQQDSLAVQLALSAFRNLHQRLTIVNVPEFDWPLGHLHGGIADRWLAWKLTTALDDDIASVQDELRREHILKQTLFVITADHGMLGLRHTVSHSLIEKAVADAGTSLIDYQYHSAGYLWLRDRTRSQAVAQNVLALHTPDIEAVYYRVPGTFRYERAQGLPIAAATNRAYQFLLSTEASDGSPQVVIMLKEDSSIAGRNETGWRGDHGGASWHSEHIPLIFSGPGIRRGVHSAYPATIYDIAPTILTLMSAPHDGMDGIPLADALTNPTDADVSTEQARGARFEPYVQALVAQSRRDLGK